MKHANQLSISDAVFHAAEYVALGLQIPDVWKNLLDKDSLEALEELRKVTDGSDSTTNVIGEQCIP